MKQVCIEYLSGSKTTFHWPIDLRILDAIFLERGESYDIALITECNLPPALQYKERVITVYQGIGPVEGSHIKSLIRRGVIYHVYDG